MRATLFDPLQVAIGQSRRLFLAPDGDLARLPFEVLPTTAGQRLIDDFEISYVAVGRDVLRFGAPAPGEPAEPLVAADPDFDLRVEAPIERSTRPRHWPGPRDLRASGLHFRRLPGTRSEGEQVAKVLGVRPMLDSEVLEDRLKSCRSPRIMHLATQGFFLADQQLARSARVDGDLADADAPGVDSGTPAETGPDNPLLRSGLALAGANTWLARGVLPEEAEDGILTAEDVASLDLWDTELVVLSACETGLGDVHVGEGVFGLRRAFMLAGARTLVMSLWKVPDEETQELMAEFYQHLSCGTPRARALRKAQLVMKGKHPEPRYWGAFVCQGDPGPLARASWAP